MSLEILGIREVQERLARLAQNVVPAAAQAVQTEAERILEISQPLVPIDTSLLVSTGMVEGPFREGSVVSSTIRYGGHGLAPYAILQHMETRFNHPNGGQAFYLQQPLFEAVSGLLERYVATMQPFRER